MDKHEIFKQVQPVIELLAIGKEFKVSELFDPIVWMSYPIKDIETIQSLFPILVTEELKELVKIKEYNLNLSKQVYVKIGNKTIKPQVNVFPNEPVTIKRNERGNA